MSLIRQVWLLLSGVLLLALLGSVAAHTLLNLHTLRQQLQLRNDDGAAMLVLVLSQQQGDPVRIEKLLDAQFDTGHYHRLRLLRDDGSLLVEREQPEHANAAPPWFTRLLPVTVAPGQAVWSDGGMPAGRLQLWSRSDGALDALWNGCLRMAGWLALLGLAAVGVAACAVRGWRRPLEACIAQAQALQERRFVIADEPRMPEFQRLTRSMNTLVRRLQAVFEQQATTLDELRRQAQADAVTGLLQRRPFMAQLELALHGEQHRGAGLLLVRLRHLEAMNRRIGHDATDRRLAALAQVLQSYPEHVKGALTGRLNGSDFALYLPAAGMAGETARSLLEALRAALEAVDREAELAIGGADLSPPCNAADALSRADGALAQAESDGAFALAIAPAASGDVPVRGQRAWQARLTAALQEGRARLAALEVRDAKGELVHLHCPLLLQLDADGPFEPSPCWLAMAVRCRLVAQVDRAAIGLALQANGEDGRPRAVKVAAASLAGEDFVAQVLRQLQAAPEAAARLRIELAEGAAQQPRRLREAIVAWQRVGVRIGLELGGARLRELPQLQALGLDYVRIDGTFVQGVGAQPAVRELAQGLVRLLRGMQLQVLVDAVQDEDDLRALWALGFDGAGGPAPR